MGGRLELRTVHLEKLPIVLIDQNNKTQKSSQEKIIALVERMLATKRLLSLAVTEKDTNFYTRECDAISRQIDALVYGLYGLTEAEIALVEGAA